MKWGKKVKVPVQYAWVGRVASLPPPPRSVDGAMEGGEGWRAGSSLGILSREQASRKLKWQIFLGSKFGGLFLRVNPADFHGKIFWRIYLAGYFGAFIWRVFTVNEANKF
jgi:hypothetical protein